MIRFVAGRLRDSRAWNHGKEPIAFGLVAALVGAIVSFILTPSYLVRAQIALNSPTQGTISNSLLGLAQQFGIAPSGGQNTPEFLQAFFASEDILEAVAQTRFPRSTYNSFETRTSCNRQLDACDLVHVWRVRGKNSRDTLERAALALSELISTEIDAKNGLLSLRVRGRTPQLSLATATRLIEVVDSASMEMQRRQASDQLRFMQVEVESARANLRAAEDSLAAFDVANRSVQSSPSLVRHRARLERNLTLAETFYVQLETSVEQLYLAAAKNVSTISMVQSPQLPGRRDSPKRTVITLLAFALGIVAWGARRYGGVLFAELQRSSWWMGDKV